MNTNQVWIGLVGLKPKKGNQILGKNVRGAFVYVLAWTNSVAGYKKMVKEALIQHNFVFDEVEDVSTFKQRYYASEPPKDLLSLSKKVQKNYGVYFGEFFVYVNRTKFKIPRKNIEILKVK